MPPSPMAAIACDALFRDRSGRPGRPGRSTSAARPMPQRVIAAHVDRDLTADDVECDDRQAPAAAPRLAAAKPPAKPAPPRILTTPGSSASPPIMSPACGWATTISSPMRGVTGGTLPAEIWRDVMTAAEKGLPATPLARSPPGVPVDETLMDSPALPVTTDDEAHGHARRIAAAATAADRRTAQGLLGLAVRLGRRKEAGAEPGSARPRTDDTGGGN